MPDRLRRVTCRPRKRATFFAVDTGEEIRRASDSVLCWRWLMVTMPALANTGTATATWPKRLASRGISTGPRPCHNRGMTDIVDQQ
jgi:hypothetical protein